MINRMLGTLRGQLLLMAALFAGSYVLAGLVAWQHPWFEGHVHEKYGSGLGNAAQLVIAPGMIRELSPDQKKALWESWMLRHVDGADAASNIANGDAEYFLRRAEQTLVCGDAAQQIRAAQFLELAGRHSSPGAIARALRRATRLKQTELASRLQVALRSVGEERPTP